MAVGDDDLRKHIGKVMQADKPAAKAVFSTNLLKFAAALVGMLVLSLVAIVWTTTTKEDHLTDVNKQTGSDEPIVVVQNEEKHTSDTLKIQDRYSKSSHPDYLALAKANHHEPELAITRAESTVLDTIYQLYEDKNGPKP